MTILEIFSSIGKLKKSSIGIGLGQEKEHNIKILKASIEFLDEFDSNISFFGNENAIAHVKNSKNYNENLNNLDLIKSNDPEREIINFLNNGVINAVVRGSLGSSKFLKNVKEQFNVFEINRLALLETYDGSQFFYGPIGIDECNSIENKINFVNKAIKELESLNIKPKISILSGGRLGDVGRDSQVDKTINMAQEIVNFFKKENQYLEINHDAILIENAIHKKSNIIIAPDGVSGNLIYRTLVHLGGGKAYGAIYMDMDKTIIDTSRVGKFSEIKGALILALALASL